MVVTDQPFIQEHAKMIACTNRKGTQLNLKFWLCHKKRALVEYTRLPAGIRVSGTGLAGPTLLQETNLQGLGPRPTRTTTLEEPD